MKKIQSPRGSIKSDDEEEKVPAVEKKDSDSAQLKYDFTTNLNNRMVFEHRRVKSFNTPYLDENCIIHLVKDYKNALIEDHTHNKIYKLDLQSGAS